MDVFCRENIKTPLPRFVGDTVPYSWTNHNLHTVHVVVHHVLQSRQQCLMANGVKVNFFRGSDLEPVIPSDEIEKSSHWQRVVFLPFSLASFIISDDFVKSDSV